MREGEGDTAVGEGRRPAGDSGAERGSGRGKGKRGRGAVRGGGHAWREVVAASDIKVVLRSGGDGGGGGGGGWPCRLMRSRSFPRFCGSSGGASAGVPPRRGSRTAATTSAAWIVKGTACFRRQIERNISL